ncbi:MAG: reverse transcriptase domain-containing protein, partial [Anaerolineae bacterium]
SWGGLRGGWGWGLVRRTMVRLGKGKKKEPSLFSQVYEVKNLTDAWRKVRSNVRVADRKHSQGVDLVSLQDFEANWEENMANLAIALEEGTYLPMPVKRVKIRKKGGGTRTISILSVQDRIAQRAVLNVLEPIFEGVFLDCSFGFRPERSIQDAVERIIEYRAEGYTWVVDADIEACFDSIDHDILMALLGRYIDDQEMLRLIKLWLKVGMLGMAAVEEEASRKGIAIPFETLFGLTKGYMERAVDWGIEHLLEREGGMSAYPFVEEELELEVRASEEVAREEALRRLSGDLLLLLLSFSRPVLKRVKKLPALGKRAAELATPRNVAVGVAVALLGALVPVARKSLTPLLSPQPFGLAQGRRWGEGGEGPVGTPQGGALSPLLANVYLHEFDVAMVGRGHQVVRYADDLVILCRAEGEARRGLADAERVLASLRLRLNPAKTHIVPFDEGFSFLGAVFAGEGVVEKPEEGPSMERLRAIVGRGYQRVRERGGKVVERGQEVAMRSGERAREAVRAGGERVGPAVAGVRGRLRKRVGRGNKEE